MEGWSSSFSFNSTTHVIRCTTKSVILLYFKFRPKNILNEKIYQNTNRENLKLAFDLAEFYFKVPKLLDPEDIDSEIVDERSIMTYLSSLFISLSQVKCSDTIRDLKYYFHESYPQLDTLYKWIDEKIFFLQNNNGYSIELIDFKTQKSDIKIFFSNDLKLKTNEIKKIITEYGKNNSYITENIYQEILNKWEILIKLIENKNNEIDKIDFEFENTKDFKNIGSQINILEIRLQEISSIISSV